MVSYVSIVAIEKKMQSIGSSNFQSRIHALFYLLHHPPLLFLHFNSCVLSSFRPYGFASIPRVSLHSEINRNAEDWTVWSHLQRSGMNLSKLSNDLKPTKWKWLFPYLMLVCRFSLEHQFNSWKDNKQHTAKTQKAWRWEHMNSYWAQPIFRQN